MSKTVQYLDKNTARLITSNQVILGPYNVVKELVENALDACATHIEIRLDNFGLDKIEVKDNGKGVKKSDVAVMFLPGHSSKIKEFSDISKISTYGFRGEALGALCCVAECTVTTKTSDDKVAHCYKVDCSGQIVESKPSHLGQGTTVGVAQLFCHQPARRRMLVSGKSGGSLGASKATTMTNIRNYLGAIGVAWPEIRISLVHNGSLVWRKQPASATNKHPTISALGDTLGHALAVNFHHLHAKSENMIAINLLVPKIGSNIKPICQSTKSGMIIIVNKRIIHHKKIENVLMQHFSTHFPNLGRHKYIACVAELILDPQDLDVNLEPDKSKIIINSEKEVLILEELDKLLKGYYVVHVTVTPNTLEENMPSDKQNFDNHMMQCEVTKPPQNETIDDSEVKVIEDMEIQCKEPSEPAAKKQKIDLTINGVNADANTNAFKAPGFTIEFYNNDETISSADKYFKSGVSDVRTEQALETLEESMVNASVSAPVLCMTGVSPSKCNVMSEPKSPVIIDKPEQNYLLGKNPSASAASTVPVSSLPSSQSSILSKDSSDSANLSVLDSSVDISDDDHEALLELEKLYSSNTVLEVTDPVIQPESQSMQSAWSRGQLSTGAGKIKSTSILISDPVPLPTNIQSYDISASPSSQMGFRELAGFSLFCKEARPQILKADPGLLFTKVAQMLARQWKELPMEEKERYGELAKEYKQTKRVAAMDNNRQQVQNTSPAIKKNSNLKNAQVTKKSAENKQTVKNSKSDTKSKKPIRKEIEININLSDLEHPKSKSSMNSNFDVIGKVRNCWLIKQEANIEILCPWALLEVVLFEQLKTEMVLPVAALDQPLDFGFREIGYQAWHNLAVLESNYNIINNQIEITSPLITSNGFHIVVQKDSDNSLKSAQLTHITTAVPDYGLVQLKEILLQVGNHVQCSLSNSRPESVIKYMQGLATQNARDTFRESNGSSTMIGDMLKEWNSMQLNGMKCLQDDEIFVKLHTIVKTQD